MGMMMHCGWLVCSRSAVALLFAVDASFFLL